MKKFRFNEDKDKILKEKRGLGFKNIIKEINKGKLIKIIDNQNKKQYLKQKIYLILIKDYVFAVPCIEEEQYIFLKTIYPSRKYTKKYLIKIKNSTK